MPLPGKNGLSFVTHLKVQLDTIHLIHDGNCERVRLALAVVLYFVPALTQKSAAETKQPVILTEHDVVSWTVRVFFLCVFLKSYLFERQPQWI